MIFDETGHHLFVPTLDPKRVQKNLIFKNPIFLALFVSNVAYTGPRHMESLKESIFVRVGPDIHSA